ncbi:MAG: paraquat-inducible protein A [Flavobacteriales bacterium]
MELSSITYGLFNPDQWKEVLTAIVTKKIEDFQITDDNREQLKKQVVEMLTKVIGEVEDVMDESNKKHGFTGLVRGVLKDMLVDMKDIKAGIPRYADQILDYLNDPKSRDEIKGFVMDRIDSMAVKTVGTVDYSVFESTLARNGMTDKVACIEHLRLVRSDAHRATTIYGSALLLIMASMLTILFSRRENGSWELGTLVITAMILLVTALTLPMIDIEATIADFSFYLIGEPVVFKDQVLFYQSKSILQVVRLLLKGPDAGLVFVAVLVFSFSVLIPFMKLITSFVVAMREREPTHWLPRFLVLKSSKWSMADVLVVALFMAYLGFNGVVNGELRELREYSTLVHIMTTNNSTLEFGFYLFTGYCITGLLISLLIERRHVPS